MSCSTTIIDVVLLISRIRVGGLVDLFVGHARRRLVEQDKLRLAGKHGAELDPLALAVGELADDAAGQGAEAEALQDLVDDAVGLAPAVMAARRDPDVLVHRSSRRRRSAPAS